MEFYVPQFVTDARIYPPLMPDQRTPNDGTYFTSIRPREFARPETAAWVAREFDGEVFTRDYPGGAAVNADKQKVEQHCVSIFDSDTGKTLDVPAGHIAWYFTRKAPDFDPADEDAGYWSPDTSDESVMTAGKQAADLFITQSLQFVE